MEKNYYNLYLKYKSKYINLKSHIENNSNINQTGGNIIHTGLKMVNKFQTGGSAKKEVILFKAEWCGHCVGFKPDWQKLKTNHKSKYNFITYDSEKNKEELKSWQIQGFPTIIVKKGNEAMEYVGPNEYTSVLEFIENI